MRGFFISRIELSTFVRTFGTAFFIANLIDLDRSIGIVIGLLIQALGHALPFPWIFPQISNASKSVEVSKNKEFQLDRVRDRPSQ